MIFQSIYFHYLLCQKTIILNIVEDVTLIITGTNWLSFVQNDNDKAIVTDEVPILGAHTIVYGFFRGSGFLSETKQEAIEEYGIIEKNYTSYILYEFFKLHCLDTCS